MARITKGSELTWHFREGCLSWYILLGLQTLNGSITHANQQVSDIGLRVTSLIDHGRQSPTVLLTQNFNPNEAVAGQTFQHQNGLL